MMKLLTRNVSLVLRAIQHIVTLQILNHIQYWMFVNWVSRWIGGWLIAPICLFSYLYFNIITCFSFYRTGLLIAPICLFACLSIPPTVECNRFSWHTYMFINEIHWLIVPTNSSIYYLVGQLTVPIYTGLSVWCVHTSAWLNGYIVL